MLCYGVFSIHVWETIVSEAFYSWAIDWLLPTFAPLKNCQFSLDTTTETIKTKVNVRGGAFFEW